MSSKVTKNIGIVVAIIIVLVVIIVLATRDSAEEEETTPTPSDDTSQIQPESTDNQPADADTSNDDEANQNTTDSNQDEVEPVPTDDSVDTSQPINTDTDNVLPADWDSLTPAEKIQRNPYECEDTTKIRADNGQCIVDQITTEAQSEETVHTDDQDNMDQSSEQTEDSQTSDETSSTQDSDDDTKQEDTTNQPENDNNNDNNSGNNNNNSNNNNNNSGNNNNNNPTPTPEAKKNLEVVTGPIVQAYLFPTGQSGSGLTLLDIAWYVKVSNLIDGVETTKAYSAECPDGLDFAIVGHEVRYPNSELLMSYVGCKITFTNGDQTLVVDAKYITPSTELIDAVNN